MAMHWSGEEGIKLKQKLARQQREMEKLRQSIKNLRQLKRDQQKENKHLKQSRSNLKITLAVIEKEKCKLAKDLAALKCQNRISELEQENRMLKEKLETLSAASGKTRHQTASMKKKNKRLAEELQRQKQASQLIKREARELMDEVFALSRCDASCPSFDLCKKRILIVGGMTRIKSLYRELIENSGGIFEYHDGYMKNGVRQLEQRLRRADVVVCPVNCNSHAACSIVKNLAKKHNKTAHMLTNFSLNAVSRVIWGPMDNAQLN